MTHSVFVGRATHVSLKQHVEVGNVIEAAKRCNVQNGIVGVDQKLAGSFDSDLIDVSDGADVHALLEFGCEMADAEVGQVGQLLEGNVLIKMLVDIGQNGLQVFQRFFGGRIGLIIAALQNKIKQPKQLAFYCQGQKRSVNL